jgi:FtsP/CotA-like multicopper oxidase with cupredoxin domain
MEMPTQAPAKAAEILDPLTITKFAEPLVIPPVMPSEGTKDWNGEGQPATEYKIAVRQFEQQVLPAGFPKTTVWGYGHYGDALPGGPSASTFNYPAFTIEARSNELVRVVWVNQLVDDPASAAPKFLPPLLPVDQTLHWANPGGRLSSHGMDPEPYQGPVPIIPHVHGAHVPSNSDGLPEAWFLPQAADILGEFAAQGPAYDSVHPAPPGGAVFEYPNDQRAMTLWYHDHTLGMTRVNVYSGLAGFWILRDESEDGLNLPGPAPRPGDAAGTRYYEIPMAIQDRTFNTDGSLFYPSSRAFFDEYAGPYAPETDVSPIWNPEFFGNSIVVNGRTWPYLEVEPRLYRFRLLNGSNARFLILKFDRDLSFHQIGNEGGLLPDKPIELQELLMAPAERADVIVDFSAFKPGEEITLLNLGPDSPFGNLPVDPADQSNPETTGLVMQFKVIDRTDQGNPGQIPAALPAIPALTTSLPPRDVTLNEKANQQVDIPVEAQLGSGADGPLDFNDDVTEKPTVGDTEIWRIINLTEDAHPIHLHLVHFQVLDRIPFDREAYAAAQQAYIAAGKQGSPPDPLAFATGDPIPPGLWEAGWKDTVVANPDMITRIIANFDLSGMYVWHCHILEHEDNEMMRPIYVLPK